MRWSKYRKMRIRRGLGSRRLRCGCLAGVYETYRDEIVTILDVPSTACAHPDHVTGSVLASRMAGSTSLEAESPHK